MKIDVRKAGEISVFELEGELAFGKPLALIERRFDESIAAGERLFLFDLRRVPWLDSSGLGQLVACHQAAREHRGVVKLVLVDRSRELFKIARLEKMFELFDDVDGALASFDAPDGGYRERF